MKYRRVGVFGLIITCIIFSIFLFTDIRGKHNINQKRMNDITELTKVFLLLKELNYRDINNNFLLNSTLKNVICLSNPIAIDTNKPCYKIIYPLQVWDASAGNSNKMQAVIMETANVSSPYVLVSFVDGHVQPIRRVDVCCSDAPIGSNNSTGKK